MKCGYCKKEIGVVGYILKDGKFLKSYCPHCKHEFKNERY